MRAVTNYAQETLAGSPKNIWMQTCTCLFAPDALQCQKQTCAHLIKPSRVHPQIKRKVFSSFLNPFLNESYVHGFQFWKSPLCKPYNKFEVCQSKHEERGFDVLRPIWSSEIPAYQPAREAPWTFSELWLLLCNIWHVDINAEALHPPRLYVHKFLAILIFQGQSCIEGKVDLNLSECTYWYNLKPLTSDPLPTHSFDFIEAPLSSSTTLSESPCYIETDSNLTLRN